MAGCASFQARRAAGLRLIEWGQLANWAACELGKQLAKTATAQRRRVGRARLRSVQGVSACIQREGYGFATESGTKGLSLCPACRCNARCRWRHPNQRENACMRGLPLPKAGHSVKAPSNTLFQTANPCKSDSRSRETGRPEPASHSQNSQVARTKHRLANEGQSPASHPVRGRPTCSQPLHAAGRHAARRKLPRTGRRCASRLRREARAR